MKVKKKKEKKLRKQEKTLIHDSRQKLIGNWSYRHSSLSFMLYFIFIISATSLVQYANMQNIVVFLRSVSPNMQHTNQYFHSSILGRKPTCRIIKAQYKPCTLTNLHFLSRLEIFSADPSINMNTRPLQHTKD